jgi:hypothetical protein
MFITDMVTELQRSTLVGKQFTFLIANYQRYLGTSTPFFQQNPADYPYKPLNSRITFIWERMHQNQIIASSDTWWLPKTAMINDLAIMDAFILGKKRLQGTPSAFSDTMMKNANSVRLYLRCTFISDILGSDKCSIAGWAAAGGPPLQGSNIPSTNTSNRKNAPTLAPTCFLSANNLITTPPTSTFPPPQQIPPPATFSQYLLTNEDGLSIMGPGVLNKDHIAEFFAHRLRTGLTIKALGDGTVKDGIGEHGWHIRPDLDLTHDFTSIESAAETGGHQDTRTQFHPSVRKAWQS